MKKVKYGSNAEWLALRKNGIGGSDIGAICGVSKWETPLDVYNDKTNPDFVIPENEAMWYGKKEEPIVAERFSILTGKDVRNDNHIIIDEEYPYFFANIDRKIVGEDAILECKTTDTLSANLWADGKIPDNYYLQMMWYLGVTKYTKGYFVCKVGNRETIIREVERDENLIAQIREEAKIFWNENILKRVPPSATVGDEWNLHQMWEPHEEEKDLSDLIDIFIVRNETLKEIDGIKAQLKEKEDIIKQCEISIKEALQGADKGVCGNFVVSHKWGTRKSVDTNKLKSEYAEVYNDCLKETETSRFSIKEIE